MAPFDHRSEDSPDQTAGAPAAFDLSIKPCRRRGKGCCVSHVTQLGKPPKGGLSRRYPPAAASTRVGRSQFQPINEMSYLRKFAGADAHAGPLCLLLPLTSLCLQTGMCIFSPFSIPPSFYPFPSTLFPIKLPLFRKTLPHVVSVFVVLPVRQTCYK